METMPLNELKPGDMIYRSLKDLEVFDHWGNYAGSDAFGRFWVFEHGKGGTCRLSLFDDFARGYQVKCERIEDSQRELAVLRMKELLSSPKEYDVLGFNCEHASKYVAKGVKESSQITSVLLTLGLATFVYLALKKSTNG